MTGNIPDSIVNLKYLTMFNIFNDAREYEGDINTKRNTIYNWNPKMHELLFLEEINFMYLDMEGSLAASFNNLSRLKAINLAHNKMSGSLPDDFTIMPNLEYIQLSFNQFSGSIPGSLVPLQRLKFVDFNKNSFSGSIPILESKELIGLEFSSNQLTGDFPNQYFR